MTSRAVAFSSRSRRHYWYTSTNETLGVAGVKNTEGSSSLGDGLMSKFVGILDLLAVAGVVFALERDGGVSDSVDLGL